MLMKSYFNRWMVLVFGVLAVCSAMAQKAVQLPGLRPDGAMLLPNQWVLRPAGSHIELDDFPVNIQLHAKGKLAAVLYCGYSKHVVLMVDLADKKVISRTYGPEAFYGLCYRLDEGKVH